MDAEATQLAGAGLHERSESRLTNRNGYREREWDTRVGTVDLQIPKLRWAPTSASRTRLSFGLCAVAGTPQEFAEPSGLPQGQLHRGTGHRRLVMV